MDFVRALRTFIRVVDAGSFSQAADQLSASTAAVTRQVAALEKHVQIRLLNRTTRKLSLSSAGQAFVVKARRLLEEIEAAENFGREQPEALAGSLRVTAPLSFGVSQLAPLLLLFRTRYPKVRLDVDLSDRVLDLAANGFDVALRISHERSPQLAGRRLAPVRLVLCAAPQYLQARGVPRHPTELSEHETLSYSYLSFGETWPFADPAGAMVNVRISPSVSATNGEVLRDLAVAGEGIILQPTFIVGAELARGALVPILSEWKAPELSLYALYLSHRQLSAKVRAFVDCVVEAMDDEPTWETWRSAAA